MNPFFDSLAQELQAHAQPAAPDSSHPPAQLCPSAAPDSSHPPAQICPSAASSSKTYRIDDIAAILDISRAAAYALVKKQNFRSIRVGHSIRVLRASFDAWLEEEGL